MSMEKAMQKQEILVEDKYRCFCSIIEWKFKSLNYGYKYTLYINPNSLYGNC